MNMNLLHPAFIDRNKTVVKYGLLYNGYVLTLTGNDSILSSDNWILPGVTEWQTFINYLGGLSVLAGKLKQTGYIFWDEPNTGATNEVWFNARGSGYYYSQNGFQALKQNFLVWAENSSSTHAYYYSMGYSGTSAVKYLALKGYYFSIRPVKTSTTLSHGQQGVYVGNDGRKYRTICVGTQEWLADNLAETKYRNGTTIINNPSGSNPGRLVYNNDINNL
jgi:uncharacterized protein (TIGR02145 family)